MKVVATRFRRKPCAGITPKEHRQTRTHEELHKVADKSKNRNNDNRSKFKQKVSPFGAYCDSRYTKTGEIKSKAENAM